MQSAFLSAISAYRFVLGRPGLIFRFGGLPLITCAILMIATDSARTFLIIRHVEITRQVVHWDSSASLLIFLGTRLPLWLALIWVVGLIGMRWHRLIHSGEIEAPFTAFSLGAGGRSYVRNLVIILVLGSVPAVLLSGVLNGLVSPAPADHPRIAMTLFSFMHRLVAVVILGLLLGRIGLVLPAAAMGHPMRQVEAWELSKPSAIWNVALIVLVNLPIQAIAACEWLAGYEIFLAIVRATDWVVLYRPIYTVIETSFHVAILGLTIAVTAVALSYNYVDAIGAPHEHDQSDANPKDG